MHVQRKNGIGPSVSPIPSLRYRILPIRSHWSPNAKDLLRPIEFRYLERMRRSALLLSGLLVLAGLGCMKRVPAQRPPADPVPAKVPVLNVRSLGTPSALIDPAPEPATDKMPFDLPLGKGYGIEGGWRGPNQVKGTRKFERIGDFTLRKADNVDVDPKEVAETLEKWIGSSGVQSTQSSGTGTLQRSIDYGTSRTLGSISYSVRHEAAAKEVTFHIEVREQPR